MKHWLQSGIIPDAGTAAVMEAYMALPAWDLQSGGEDSCKQIIPLGIVCYGTT